MPKRTISITDDLHDRLSEETNASGLIVSLLNKHYYESSDDIPTDILTAVTDLQEISRGIQSDVSEIKTAAGV